MKQLVTMREALSHPSIFGGLLDGESWLAWRAILIAAMGEALTDEEREAFTRLTGRESEPLEPVEELWGVIGRRGGKTRAASILGLYLAILCDHSDVLVPGEQPVGLLLAQTVKQARTAHGYMVGTLEDRPDLRRRLVDATAEMIELDSGVNLEVRPASFRGLRGPTTIFVIADEIAFWRGDDSGSVNPDSEILAAVRPSLATTGGPLIAISSPYARKGELFNTFRRHHGPEGDPLILVAKGTSREFNPSLPQKIVDRALERDAAAASAEYLAAFRSDIEDYIQREVVEACVSPGVVERAPISDITYRAFVDPSGGSKDSMTLGISHREGDRIILDATREKRPPFSPEDTVDEFASLLKSYGIATVRGDRYGGEWPRERFRKNGITYLVAEKTKSDLYRDLLPVLNSGMADLLDSDRLVGQIAGLERRVARGGRESIDHPPNAHDDLANVVAGAVDLCRVKHEFPAPAFGTYGTHHDVAPSIACVNDPLPPPTLYGADGKPRGRYSTAAPLFGSSIVQR